MDLKYNSVAEIVAAAEESGQKISEITLAQQAVQLETSQDEVYKKMLETYRVMEKSAVEGLQPNLRSASGLTGGDAFKMARAAECKNTLCGSFMADAITRALAVSEYNAAMGRIVASPTAGSCGILPAAVITMKEQRSISERAAVMSLFTASAIGMVIAANACLSGAQGGCQAECGSAAAMAAAALVELAGGTPKMIANAVAITIKNILGLVCDPVAGLVEIPCIKRNASGVAGAITAAELALAGINSAIPADEVIWAMKRVGDTMPAALRETAEGGLAATPTAKLLNEQVFGK